MPFPVLRAYARQLAPVEARAQLAAIEAAGFPFREATERRQRIVELLELADIAKPGVERPTSPDDLARRMAGVGIAVERVS